MNPVAEKILAKHGVAVLDFAILKSVYLWSVSFTKFGVTLYSVASDVGGHDYEDYFGASELVRRRCCAMSGLVRVDAMECRVTEAGTELIRAIMADLHSAEADLGAADELREAFKKYGETAEAASTMDEEQL